MVEFTELSELSNKVFTLPMDRIPPDGASMIVELFTGSTEQGSRKLLASLNVILHQIIIGKAIKIVESMDNSDEYKNKLQISFSVEIKGDSMVVTDGESEGQRSIEGEKALGDIQRNISILEESYRKSVCSQRNSVGSCSKQTAPVESRSPSMSRNRASQAFRRVRAMMRVGRRRASMEEALLGSPGLASSGTGDPDLSGDGSDLSTAEGGRPDSTCSQRSESDLVGAVSSPLPQREYGSRHKRRKDSSVLQASTLRAEDYQICVTVVEARQLAGLNMDPVICIQVGDSKKYTSVKESTNCPYFNEYFVFDFHMAPTMLFEKIITLTVLQSRNIIRSGKVVGSFKLDVATVWCQPGHQFYRKWALLTDPDDPSGGPKGYVKCDISVVGKGDTATVPNRLERDEDDIEANLLLPDGVTGERQKARISVQVYGAESLPRPHSSLVANVRRALTGESRDLVNAYVRVSFAGLTARTSVKKAGCNPVWNQQVVFTDMFPPLCQRIKLQLRVNNTVTDSAIGTHFIDLTTISNDGDKGFLPTFGPAYIHLYGSSNDQSFLGFESTGSSLNEGLGEGVSYRGRVLVSIQTDILDSIEPSPAEVEVEPISPLPEHQLGKKEDFFLFATILEASMIPRAHGDKPLNFELSIGSEGSGVYDGVKQGSRRASASTDDGAVGLECVSVESAFQQLSQTPPLRPITCDKLFCHLPYWENKPCLHLSFTCTDQRHRLFLSNRLHRIASRFEQRISEVQELSDEDTASASRVLCDTLEALCADCGQYVSAVREQSSSGVFTGQTQLDKHRSVMCRQELQCLIDKGRRLRLLTNPTTLKENLRTTLSYLQRLRFLVEDPQPSLPDVILWLLSGGRKLAYYRVPVSNIVYSSIESECGSNCSKVQTVFLKYPNRRGQKLVGWTVPAKLQLYLWLGLSQQASHSYSGLPQGYQLLTEASLVPPSTLHYIEKQRFQLRAHLYQARSLIGSDNSGLSDPFARVIFGEQSQCTQIIYETLSPTWNEVLVFDDVILYGSMTSIERDQPTVVIEIFDEDSMGKSEFLGRTTANVHIKRWMEPYRAPRFPPSLEWHQLYRGVEQAGELLAVFELLQIKPDSECEVDGGETMAPQLRQTRRTSEVDASVITAIPRQIQPTLVKYRLEVLFWGLRALKRVHFLTVDCPRVDVECGGSTLHSSVLQSYSKNPNFPFPAKMIELELPEEEVYCPPVTFRVVDCRSFGRFTLVGTHIVSNIHRYMVRQIAFHIQPNQDTAVSEMGRSERGVDETGSGISDSEQCPLLSKEPIIQVDFNYRNHVSSSSVIKSLSRGVRKNRRIHGRSKPPSDRYSPSAADDPQQDVHDWWTKYFASKEAAAERMQSNESTDSSAMSRILNTSSHLAAEAHTKRHEGRKNTRTTARAHSKSRRKFKNIVPLLKIYPCELEAVTEFGGFREWLLTFDLYRGKKWDDFTDDETRVVGKFKGSMKLYRWPPARDFVGKRGGDPYRGFFTALPSNDPIHVLVRVYIVCALDLHPMDINGKADPYIVVLLGNRKFSDKENYQSKQLNPVFGKCFEVESTFPQDSMLTVQIWDWDLVGSDDLIGETRIDLENRFYSKHRATCGLDTKFEMSGYNTWRDSLRPTQILQRLCKEAKLDGPHYQHGTVRIGSQTFSSPSPTDNRPTSFKRNKSNGSMDEELALHVLHNWQEVQRVGCVLVPAHVETRPLYTPDKPGIERGKLELWVDMFPMDMPPPPPAVDIAPRKPTSYELRVIIWNTDDVILEDDAFFTGEKMSDIYVKGWVRGPEDCQSTDIHYRSLTGEGNFNWRFIFPFDYIVAEEKIVISRRESLFSWDESESKIPARLQLQVWDADHFSADDFLGQLTLDLNRFPRGAKSAKYCSLYLLNTDNSVPMVSIFKQKRIKGWWPFYVKNSNDEQVLTGKVEAEIHLLTSEEADKSPAGLGRAEPDPLDKPSRPDSSFMWFINPIKSVRYIVWHNYKWTILKLLLTVLLALLLFVFFYSIPEYTVKRMLGA